MALKNIWGLFAAVSESPLKQISEKKYEEYVLQTAGQNGNKSSGLGNRKVKKTTFRGYQLKSPLKLAVLEVVR